MNKPRMDQQTFEHIQKLRRIIDLFAKHAEKQSLTKDLREAFRLLEQVDKEEK